MKMIVDAQPVYVATGQKKFDPELPSVVFIHGTGQDHTIWVLPTRYFARHQRNVLAIDLPGHGRSGGKPLASIEAMADWIVKVMDVIAVDSAAMVGHSMGSLVAMVLAAKYADRVRAIGLVGTAVPMPVSEPLLNSAKENSPDAIEMLTLWGAWLYSPSRWQCDTGNVDAGGWKAFDGTRCPRGYLYRSECL